MFFKVMTTSIPGILKIEFLEKKFKKLLMNLCYVK